MRTPMNDALSGALDDDLMAALAILARPGTIAPVLPERCGSTMMVGLVRTRTDGAETVGTIGGSTAETLRERAWIEPHPRGGWRISRDGIGALRRFRSMVEPVSAAGEPPGAGGGARKTRDRDVATVNPSESPLGWLWHRKGKDGAPLISEAQFLAGERLRADFWRAHMTPRVTAAWTDTAPTRRQRRSTPGAGIDLADSVIAAKDRIRRALVAVGPELAGILVDVCCHLKGLEEAERIENLPQRSGKVILLTALSSLARHYGLVPAAAVEAQVAGRIRAWSDGDFSPNLDAWRDRA